MKTTIFSTLVLFGAAFLFFPAPTSAQTASDGDSDSVRIAKKVLNLDDEKYLRAIEPTAVVGYGEGFVEEDGVYACDAGAAVDKTFGVSNKIELNQTKPTPIVATGWSKAENVGGNRDGEYSLYLDVVFADGSVLWGQKASFETGDSDWTQEKVVVFPKKPIASLTFYGLFRNHSGKAFFKDLRFFEYDVPAEIVLFDGVPVEPIAPPTPESAYRPSDFTSSFQLRDVAANGDFIEINDATVEVDRLRFARSFDATGASRESVVKIRNLSDDDRALTFVYARRYEGDKTDLSWGDDPRRATKIDLESTDEYSSTQSVPEIANRRLSKYPIGVVSIPTNDNAEQVWGIGIDPNYPAFYRIGFNAGTRELYLAVDFALTKEKPEVELRFVDVSVPSAARGEGFRAGLDAYRRAFPESFVVRAPIQGLWMPFAKISKVPGWEDFGFQFKEGTDETDWEDERGITTFRYTEPMTWWQSLPKDSPKTLEAAVEAAEKLAAAGDRNAQALLTTGMRDAKGNLCALFLDTPWCDGAVWSLNDAPGLVKLAKEDKLSDESGKSVAGFDLKWNDQTARELYGDVPRVLPKTPGQFARAQTRKGLDGEYVDSSEGYVTAILDYDRAHFAGMETPLVFDSTTNAPAIYRGLVSFEYVRAIANGVRERGGLAMANSTPGQFFWLVPQLDVLGTETNWNWQDKWSPMSDADLLYRRSLCGGKPYCFLMNTDFSKFGKDKTELFMRRSLAYGMFPGFFSADASTGHYFENPDLYERDRDLFKKYVPLCKLVAEAGWQAQTGARSNEPQVYVERFGDFKTGKAIYFTVFNDSQEEKAFELELTTDFGVASFDELTSDKTFKVKNGVVSGKLAPQDVLVLRGVQGRGGRR